MSLKLLYLCLPLGAPEETGEIDHQEWKKIITEQTLI